MNFKNYTFLIFILFSLLFFVEIKASDIVDVEALNSRIILLHFDDGYVRYHQKGEARTNEWVVAEPLNTALAEDVSNFSIQSKNGFYSEAKNPIKIERKSKGTEFTWLCQNWVNGQGCVNNAPDHAKEHWLYLYLPNPLEAEKTYRISTGETAGNGNTWELEFSIGKNRSEAIHVNIVGYDPRASQKYGYVYLWSGSGGSIDFSGFEGNQFYLLDNQTKEKVFTGTLEFRKSKTNTETYQTNDTPNQNFLGADVWQCDFSDFNTPGEYVLAVDGIGHSFPFKIKSDVYRLPFYTSIRGLYHNRSGIALKEPYTEFTRPAPHNPLVTPGFAGKLLYTSSRFIDWNDLNASDDDLPAIEDGLKGPLNTWGWYQDAGDWDGYFTHMKVPVMLMLTWEIAPEKFADGELNLPAGVNGIPDILDEARWLIRFFHRTRHAIMDAGYGTGGVGSRVAPDWYGHAGDGVPSYEDTGKWIISGEDPFTTYFYAGLAGHYALILNKLGVADPEGIDWKKEAEEAFRWAENNTKSDDNTPSKVHDYNLSDFQTYAAASLFRLTGDTGYAQLIEQNTSSVSSGTVLGEDQKWGIYTLLTGNEYKFENQARLDILKSSVLATADQKHSSVAQRACRFGGNMWLPMVIGQGTTPRAFEIMMGHYISREKAPAKTAIYMSDLFTTADYFLGCNPLNMAWITHVGVRYPQRVMHIDSWYNGRGEMAPGITPYGPWRDQGTATNIGPWDLHWPYKTLYPEGIENWPGHERWFNNYTTPVNAEFTIHQNTILSAVVYGYLCGEPDGSFQPNEHPVVELALSKDSVVLNEDLILTVNASDPNGDNDIAWVEYYKDWHKIGQSNEAPFSFSWNRPKYGTAKISAKIVDKSGYSSKSEEKSIEILPDDFKVTIDVKDSVTGEPLENSFIEVNEQLQNTNQDGEAVFEAVSGLFNIDIKNENYNELKKNDLAIYSDTTLTFYLSQKKREITVIVHDNNSGEVLQNATVVFNSLQKYTDENGEAFYEFYAGDYNFSVDKDSYSNESGTISVESDTIFHVFLIRTDADIKFVLKEGTTPVNNAYVILGNDTLVSNSLGITRFSDRNVNASYDYSVLKDGYYEVNGSLYLNSDTTVNVIMEISVDAAIINNHYVFNLWPNPVNDMLYFTSQKAMKRLEIYSFTGVKMKEIVVNNTEVNKINLSDLSQGIYLLKVSFNDESSVIKRVEKF